MSLMTTATIGGTQKHSQTMEEAFPDASSWVANMVPLGNTVLVQLCNAKKISAGGIVIPGESQDFAGDQTRVGKIVSMGPLAYRDRQTYEFWKEGQWVHVGDFVRVPAFAGIDKYRVKVGAHVMEDVNGKEHRDPIWAVFATYNDFDMKLLIKGDPRDIVDYV